MTTPTTRVWRMSELVHVGLLERWRQPWHAMDGALPGRNPVIWNVDRHVHFTVVWPLKGLSAYITIEICVLWRGQILANPGSMGSRRCCRHFSSVYVCLPHITRNTMEALLLGVFVYCFFKIGHINVFIMEIWPSPSKSMGSSGRPCKRTKPREWRKNSRTD